MLHFRPDSVDKYLKTQANLIGFINSQKEVLHGECLGNFNVLVGDQVRPGNRANEPKRVSVNLGDIISPGPICAHLAV